MTLVIDLVSLQQAILVGLIAVVAGFIKGVVGFALPLVLISGLTNILTPELALAGLLLPTLVANSIQAFRQGPAAAWKTIRTFRLFLLAGATTLIISAQMVRIISEQWMLLLIGAPVVFFALLLLSGHRFAGLSRTPVSDAMVGGTAGAIGGMSAIWGPPTVVYLTALGTPKHDQLRVQGVIYGMGALLLVSAHITSGVLRAETLPLSAVLVLPCMLGMWLGGKVSDRIDQQSFRRATLFVLLLAGLNLLRRALL